MQPAQQNTVMIKFGPSSYEFLKTQAAKRNKDVEGIILLALALYQLVQGKIVMLREKSSDNFVEIDTFAQDPK